MMRFSDACQRNPLDSSFSQTGVHPKRINAAAHLAAGKRTAVLCLFLPLITYKIEIKIKDLLPGVHADHHLSNKNRKT